MRWYEPPLQTVTLFADVGDRLRTGVDRIRFRWRAWVLPMGGNECVEGRADGAAKIVRSGPSVADYTDFVLVKHERVASR
jgi:hypothetical protein